MGFWSKLFKKNKNGLGQDDGQAEFFRDDFEEPKAKNTVKKSESAPSPAKKTALKEEKAQKVATPVKKAVPSTEKAPQKKPTSAKSEVKKPSANKATSNTAPAEKPKAKTPVTQAERDEKSAKTGRFEIKKTKDDRFVFNLYAPNHIIVATSQTYSSSSAAVNGINSIIANAEKSPIEDNTLKNPTKQSCPKWEMYIDKAGEYRFRLFASNGNCVVHSQGYTAKSSCKNGIESIIRCSKNAEIDKSYLSKGE